MINVVVIFFTSKRVIKNKKTDKLLKVIPQNLRRGTVKLT